eukprot:scaffold8084_cov90-Isochrysis_galbana.AAC.2
MLPTDTIRSSSPTPVPGRSGSSSTPLAETHMRGSDAHAATSKRERNVAQSSSSRMVTGTLSTHEAQLSPRTRSGISRSDSSIICAGAPGLTNTVGGGEGGVKE